MSKTRGKSATVVRSMSKRGLMTMGVVSCMLVATGALSQTEDEAVPGAGVKVAMPKHGGRGGKRVQRPAVKRPQAALEAMVLNGTIVKEEVTRGGKGRTVYKLQDAAGQKIGLPRDAAKKLETFVDQKVVITGKGRTMEVKGKKRVILATITDVKAEEDVGGEAEVAEPTEVEDEAPAADDMDGGGEEE